ncbi:MAG: metallophosphoesterase family protein [Leuconostoc gelidum]|jgi:calcineurin-like phosphoesterase family protein|uniref:Predicted phosphoesterase or phosphohydrolase n=1 Tax=Leuconostoc inhae TaxID=178001 RepID=A0AAN2QVZ5_9LACO|nr:MULTISPECIES: metallophosphoesterase family protein [Leuconostoc]AFS40099.1 putative phosphohydrolase [Leuconostoc gelidum JB7]MBZ5946368.1 metallophosphoesterase family protein [Leuconostoc gasicomitatum]MBZ5950193.1 metallophosphoesterase family protein [Leuconostoc gasicomitatum]MBZ5952094.1 metallophosphoesterase family protein [Leuconostoc gasicomitatum]MBZ5952739.1 metallophosphoesterase family protein [Leuconostoc gasicomitatum]
MQYIMSDTHFNHEKILYFDQSRAESLRALNIEPTIKNMDSYLETTWNNVVKDEDTVYFLGDLGMFRKKQDFIAQLTRLNGHIVFFKGNHDHSDQLKAAVKASETGIVEVVDTAKAVKINGVQVWLSHYAIDLPYPILSVHGHIHEAEYQSDGMINLSLDSDYMQTRRFGAPISFDELTPLLVARQKKIAERYQIESENKRYDRLIERAFDETITINKPTANQRHELALLVDYLNTNELTYADVLKAFNIPNEDKVLSNQEKEKVALTGFEFEKKINLQGNIGEKND